MKRTFYLQVALQGNLKLFSLLAESCVSSQRFAHLDFQVPLEGHLKIFPVIAKVMFYYDETHVFVSGRLEKET